MIGRGAARPAHDRAGGRSARRAVLCRRASRFDPLHLRRRRARRASRARCRRRRLPAASGSRAAGGTLRIEVEPLAAYPDPPSARADGLSWRATSVRHVAPSPVSVQRRHTTKIGASSLNLRAISAAEVTARISVTRMQENPTLSVHMRPQEHMAMALTRGVHPRAAPPRRHRRTARGRGPGGSTAPSGRAPQARPPPPRRGGRRPRRSHRAGAARAPPPSPAPPRTPR